MSISFQHGNSDSPPSPPNHLLRRGLYCRYMGCEEGAPPQFTEDSNLIQPNQTIANTFHNPDNDIVKHNRYYLIPIYVLASMTLCYFLMRMALKVHRDRRQVQQQHIQQQQAVEAAKKQKQHEEDLRTALLHEIDNQNICMIVEGSDIVTNSNSNTTSSTASIRGKQDRREEDIDVEAGTPVSLSSFLNAVQRKDSESDRGKGENNITNVKGVSEQEVGKNSEMTKYLDGEVESATNTTDVETLTTASEQDLMKSSCRIYFDIENAPSRQSSPCSSIVSRKDEENQTDVEYFLCLPCTEESTSGEGCSSCDLGDDIDDDGDDGETKKTRNKRRQEKHRRQSSKRLNRRRRQVPIMCAICLDSYEAGDAVVWSKLCTHAFHRDCLVNSLCLVKDDNKLPCPTCRQDFLTIQHNASNINENSKSNPSER